MFKRRKPLNLLTKAREATWPSMGFKRAFQYLGLKLNRLTRNYSREQIAKSIACGIAASFFPAFGTHALLAAAFAFILRAPMIIAAFGTLLVLPFILPFLFTLDFLVGRKILQALGFHGWGSETHFETEAADLDPTWFADHFYTLFIPAFVGFLVFLPLVWAASYMAIHKILSILAIRSPPLPKDKA